jgi:GT2 family glycosyltransferase
VERFSPSCDADCVPDREWLEEGVASLATADVIAGRFRFMVPEHRTVWTLIDIDASKNQALRVSLGVAETANLFVRRELFDRVGGFDATVAKHGDFDFVQKCLAAGATLRYAERAVVWHPARRNASSLLRAHWIYCRGYAERTARRRGKVEGLKLRNWVPIVQTLRARRRHGVALTLATAWLAENDVFPTFSEQLVALPLIYLVLPYFHNVAELIGAIAGIRRRSHT